MCARKRTHTLSSTSFLASARPAPRRTCLISSRRGALDNELAALRVLLFRRPVSGQCRAAFRQRRYGKTLSDAVRKASGKGSLVLDSECPVGLYEFRLRLSASAARRALRSAINSLHRAICGWRTPYQLAVRAAFR